MPDHGTVEAFTAEAAELKSMAGGRRVRAQFLPGVSRANHRDIQPRLSP
jgi:hypothetical protein